MIFIFRINFYVYQHSRIWWPFYIDDNVLSHDNHHQSLILHVLNIRLIIDCHLNMSTIMYIQNNIHFRVGRTTISLHARPWSCCSVDDMMTVLRVSFFGSKIVGDEEWILLSEWNWNLIGIAATDSNPSSLRCI